MFPEGGEINLDIKSPIVSAKHMNGRDCFVTDSIGLGIQNLAYLFSEVHIPALQVMKSAKWWGLELWVAICTAIIVWLFTSKGNKEEKNAVEEIESNESTTATTVDIPLTTIEDITYNYNEKSITNTRTGEQVKLPRHTSHHFRDAYKCRRLHSDKEGNLPKAMDYKRKGCEQQIQCPCVAIEGKPRPNKRH